MICRLHRGQQRGLTLRAFHSYLQDGRGHFIPLYYYYYYNLSTTSFSALFHDENRFRASTQ